MENEQPSLIDLIDKFIADHEMSAITFGRKAMGDPHFVRDVKNGRRLWPETEAKARQWIADYVPARADEAA